VLQNLLNIFRVNDLRNKILFTLAMILLYRFGAHLPVPGIDLNALQTLREQAEQGGVLALLNLFSGQGLTNFAIFALGIMPYITASIIMQGRCGRSAQDDPVDPLRRHRHRTPPGRGSHLHLRTGQRLGLIRCRGHRARCRPSRSVHAPRAHRHPVDGRRHRGAHVDG